MKKITSFRDIEIIVTHQLEVLSWQGYRVQWVTFMNMSLLDLCNIMREESWTYERPNKK